MPHTGNNYPRRKLLAVLPVFTMIMECATPPMHANLIAENMQGKV
jgi:hypothetical protein